MESFENVGILEAEPLSLDEPNLETALFIDDGDMVKEETTLILLWYLSLDLVYYVMC